MWSPSDKVWSPKYGKMRSPTLLKYEIIDVFCVKNIPLSLKMSSASGGGDFVPHTSYRVRPQTPDLGFGPESHGDFSPPDPLFCGVQKILKLYSVRKELTDFADQ